MFHIEKMTEAHREIVLPMVLAFYDSDAVEHPVASENMTNSFADAVSDDPSLAGHLLMDDETIVGFAYTTVFYACEVGGRCMMIEELFIKEEYRGKGYGTAFFQEISARNPNLKRLRLEISETNDQALRLYQKLGFTFLNYGQMILDKK